MLDSNVILFWLARPRELRPDAAAAIAQTDRPLSVSVASIWELEIKKAAGRLRYPDDLWSILDEVAGRVLPIGREDAISAAGLPAHHGDPFDRIIIAQAIRDELTVVTRDGMFSRYGVRVIRA